MFIKVVRCCVTATIMSLIAQQSGGCSTDCLIISEMAEAAENEQMKTMREFMLNYNKLSEVCFADCVWDFTNRKISGIENQCSLYCAEKYLKMNQRVSTRFQVV